jgi:Uma2 family endonuclease
MTFTPTDTNLHQTVALPTMYDLPSEDPEEPGLPDEFHGLQPQLLTRTLQLSGYSRQEIFTALDMNLYYDPNHTSWYKRPDWFLVVGVSRLYQGFDARSSYVLWDEKVSPIVVIEFLSPGTESEDLGRFSANPPTPKPGKPPCKFEVYESIVKVPNYIVYDAETQQLRYFQLVNGRYQEQPLAASNPLLWIPELDLGLGIWRDAFDALPQAWLRWCDRNGNFCLTDTEQEREAAERERQTAERERQTAERERQTAERERQTAERERQTAERERQTRQQEQLAREAAESQLAQTVRGMLDRGMSIADVAQITGMSPEEIQQRYC